VLEVVVVTASRRERSAFAVPEAISSIDAETMTSLGPEVVAEALRGVPGAFFQQTTPGQGIPIIRGLKGSQILHLVDGMRLNNAFFRDAPNQYLALVDPFILERVELMRGAAGSLYGADAMGGVVQLLTREVRFEGPEWQSTGRLHGAFDGADEGWLVHAGAAFGRQGSSFAGSASYANRGDRKTARGIVSPSGYESGAVAAKWLQALGDRGELMLQAQVLEQPSTPRVDELVPGFGQEEPAAEQFRFEPNRRSFLHGRWRWDLDRGSLESLELDLARQVITDDRLTQDFGSPLVITEQNESTLDGFTVQVSQRGGERWRLTWGAEIYRDTVRSARQVTDTRDDSLDETRPRFPDRSRMDSDSLYLDTAWDITPRLELEGGLRWSRFEIRLPATATSPAVNLEPDDLTGDARLAWEFRDGLRLVANVGRGFRPPNVFDLGTLGPRPGNRFNIANPDLQPESVWSYDLGLKGMGTNWSFEAFLFRLDYRDRIVSVPTGDVTPEGRLVVRSENRAEVELHGFEGGLQWLATERLEAYLAMNWTWGEERSAGGLTAPADRVPPLNGRLGLRWQVLDRLALEPFVLFAARQDRLSPRDLRDPRIDPNGTPGWADLNLNLTWRANDRVALGLRLGNLLDEAYREHGSGIDRPGRHAGLWVDGAF
jgi:outer membrane receptor protein involved in Fe transport